MGINTSTLIANSQGAMASAMANPAATPTPPVAAPVSTPAPAASSAQQTLTNFNNQQAAGGTPRKPRSGGLSPVKNDEEEGTHLSPSDAPKGTEEAAVKALSSIQIGSGLAIAFFTLIALMWLLVPTGSGYTRAQLLWFTLWGNTKLTTDASLQSSGPSPEQVAEAPQPLVQTVPVQQNSNQSQLLENIDFSVLDTYNAF